MTLTSYDSFPSPCPLVDFQIENNHRGRWNSRGDITEIRTFLLPTNRRLVEILETPMWAGQQGEPSVSVTVW